MTPPQIDESALGATGVVRRSSLLLGIALLMGMPGATLVTTHPRAAPSSDQDAGASDQVIISFDPSKPLHAHAGAVWGPTPSGVGAAMDAMVRAYQERDGDAVRKLFTSREIFLRVSDCEPPTIVDQVLRGADQAAARARLDNGKVRWDHFEEGWLLEVPKGGMPSECRAKEDVALYQARYRWVVAGRVERGEAHFLRIGPDWFFVKL